jgi:predicted  nucleic acid-binding Zn-ribbon protein
VFKSLDIEDFLSTNRTPASLKRALSSLDNYYHTIADTSNVLNQSYKILERKCNSLSARLDESRASTDEYRNALRISKAKQKELSEKTFC